jgi:hypothetical protein
LRRRAGSRAGGGGLRAPDAGHHQTNGDNSTKVFSIGHVHRSFSRTQKQNPQTARKSPKDIAPATGSPAILFFSKTEKPVRSMPDDQKKFGSGFFQPTGKGDIGVTPPRPAS